LVVEHQHSKRLLQRTCRLTLQRTKRKRSPAANVKDERKKKNEKPNGIMCRESATCIYQREASRDLVSVTTVVLDTA
jgi:hypothetical protein